jgi:hypothetical protein
MTLVVSGNKVNSVLAGNGITAGNHDGSAGITLENNDVHQTGTNTGGAADPWDALNVGEDGLKGGALCANISGNTGVASNTNYAGQGGDAVGASVGSSYQEGFHLQGYTGPAQDGGQQVEAFLDAHNTLSGPHSGDGSIAYDTNSGEDPLNFTNGNCATPGFAALGKTAPAFPSQPSASADSQARVAPARASWSPATQEKISQGRVERRALNRRGQGD